MANLVDAIQAEEAAERVVRTWERRLDDGGEGDAQLRRNLDSGALLAGMTLTARAALVRRDVETYIAANAEMVAAAAETGRTLLLLSDEDIADLRAWVARIERVAAGN